MTSFCHYNVNSHSRFEAALARCDAQEKGKAHHSDEQIRRSSNFPIRPSHANRFFITMNAPSARPLEELDLAIANLDFPEQEKELRGILEQLPGVCAVRIQEQGALIQYNPVGTSKDQIVAALRQAGLRPTVFQDSATGQTGKVDF